jgi:cyclophilin family peptidyl-prolyl cis-trans isomerase
VLERGLSNARCTVAMARTSVANSATSEFFINTGNNAALDTASGGYAAFGTITVGADVVGAMVAAPCAASPLNLGSPDCLPVPNLVITRAVQTR